MPGSPPSPPPPSGDRATIGEAGPHVDCEALLQQVVDALPEAMNVVAADGTILCWNEAAARLYGYSPIEAIGSSLDIVLPPGARGEIAKAFTRFASGERAATLDTTRRRRDGTLMEVVARVTPVLDRAGRLVAAAALLRHASASEHDTVGVRDALYAHDERESLAQVGSWVCFLDGSGRLEWSKEMRRIFGVDESAHTTLERFLGSIHPDDRAGVEAARRAAIEDGAPYDVEYRVLRGDDVRFLHVKAKVIRDSDGTPLRLVGVALDLTDRKRSEQALRETEERLMHAQKMEAIGRLAGGVAHDFNNLLSVILSYSCLLLADLRDGDPMKDDLLEVKRAGERAAALTRQLLAFSRRQVLAPRILDLDETVRDMENMLHRLLGEDIVLKLALAPHIGKVNADPGQLEQVIMNLAVNARDAMPEGGTLTIATTDVSLDAAAAASIGVPRGRYVKLTMRDDGVGMDEQTRARLFEPFFTTKPKDKGTGLGLATVLGIVQQSGGQIVVESAPGAGARFDIYLPRVACDEAAATPSLPPVSTRLSGTGTVLLVEDDDQVRALSATVLRRAGYRVLEAQNAGEALLVFEERGANIDLLLTDVVMPRVSGPRLAERLARMRPGLRVLYMSGYPDGAIAPHGVLTPDVVFLQKPVQPEALLDKVREALG